MSKIVREKDMQLDLISRLDAILLKLGMGLKLPRQKSFNLDVLYRLEMIIEAMSAGENDYVTDVPPTYIDILTQTNQNNGSFASVRMASNGKLYFCDAGDRQPDGIHVLNEETGLIEQTNITTGIFYEIIIASNEKTYFASISSSGIMVLDEDTGNILPTNLQTGELHSAGNGSDGVTYFGGYANIFYLDNTTGRILSKCNYGWLGQIEDIGVGSDNVTYFLSNNGIAFLDRNDSGIKQLADFISIPFWKIFVGHDKRTYFLSTNWNYSKGMGVFVLDESGAIVPTNVTDKKMTSAVIGGDGKIYFTSYEGYIYRLNEATGNLDYWTLVYGAEFVNSFTDSHGFTYFIGKDGLYVLDKEYDMILFPETAVYKFDEMAESKSGIIYVTSRNEGIWKLEKQQVGELFLRRHKEWVKYEPIVSDLQRVLDTGATWVKNVDGVEFKEAHGIDEYFGNLQNTIQINAPFKKVSSFIEGSNGEFGLKITDDDEYTPMTDNALIELKALKEFSMTMVSRVRFLLDVSDNVSPANSHFLIETAVNINHHSEESRVEMSEGIKSAFHEALGNNYSSNEVYTGKNWVDGSPIYRSVFNGSLTGQPDEHVKPVLLTGVNFAIDGGGYYTDTSNTKHLIRGSEGSLTGSYNHSGFFVRPNGELVMIAVCSVGFSNSPYCVWVEYIKI
jgi:outer membrane protein assembly factor BamB